MSASPTFFGRAWTVQVDTIEVESLRIVFDVHKDAGKQPNKVQLAIYNLADSTRASLKKQNVFVRIEAGYKQTKAQIFAGWVRAIEHVRDHTEWATRVTGGDGEKPIRIVRVDKSFRAGTPYATILTQLAKETTLELGNVAQVAASGNFRAGMQTARRGYVAHGRAWDAFAKLALSLGYYASVQDGGIVLVASAGATSNPAVKLDQTSGLIGSPEVAEKGLLKAHSLLNGNFYPGRQVVLSSARYNGLYKVHAVDHKGDSHGADWTSTLLLQGIPTVTPSPPSS